MLIFYSFYLTKLNSIYFWSRIKFNTRLKKCMQNRNEHINGIKNIWWKMRLLLPVARKYFKGNRIFLASKIGFTILVLVISLLLSYMIANYKSLKLCSVSLVVFCMKLQECYSQIYVSAWDVASETVMKFTLHKYYRDLSLLKILILVSWTFSWFTHVSF